MKRLLYILCVFIFASCDFTGGDGPVGYGEISVELTEDMKTRADASSYMVRVYTSADVLSYETDFDSYVTKKFPFGKYYVTAESCSETEAEEGNGRMRLFGRSDELDINAGAMVQTARITCTPANARVTLRFDAVSAAYFKDDLQVVLTGGTTPDRSLVIKMGAEDTETWFNPSVLEYSISGTLLDRYGIPAPLKTGGSVNLYEKSDIVLEIKLNLEKGQLAPTYTFDTVITESENPDVGYFNPYN